MNDRYFIAFSGAFTMLATVYMVSRSEPQQVAIQKACTVSCKNGVASFEYHGQADFKCVCVEPLGVISE